MHVLPPGLQRIRYFGFLANCHRKRRLPVIRRVLASPTTELLPEHSRCQQLLRDLLPPFRSQLCPVCRFGMLRPIEILPAYRWPARPPDDSS